MMEKERCRVPNRDSALLSGVKVPNRLQGYGNHRAWRSPVGSEAKSLHAKQQIAVGGERPAALGRALLGLVTGARSAAILGSSTSRTMLALSGHIIDLMESGQRGSQVLHGSVDVLYQIGQARTSVVS